MNDPTDDNRIHQHADLVFRTCLRLTGNAQDAADVTQEVFVAWLRQHREITGSVAAWLYGTARLRSLDWLRTNHRREHHEQLAGELPRADSVEKDWQQYLDAAMEDLEVPVRTLVVEHHLLGLTQGELAKRYRCTQATISRRLGQALDALRSGLQRRGVTASATLLIAALTASRAEACPAILFGPVLAQAHVVGTTSLLGSMLITRMGWLAWSGILAAGLCALVAVMFAGVWYWRASVLADLDRDWLTLVMGPLPERPTMDAPKAGHRYPSIETLITRLPPMDANLQARSRSIIDDLPIPKWGRADSAQTAGEMWQQLTSRRKLTAEREKYANEVLSLMSPILRTKGTAPLVLGETAGIAAAYANGQLASSEERTSWFLRNTSRVDVAIDVTNALIKELTTNTERIDDLDAWIQAHDRGCTTLFTALFVNNLYEDRDVAYLSLIQGNRLDAARTRAWLSESSPMQSLAERGIQGEVLFRTIPWLEDLRRNQGDWLQPLALIDTMQLARGSGFFLPCLSGLHAALTGQPIAFSIDAPDDELVVQRNTSGVRMLLMQTAWQSSIHRANRVAARLILDARAGNKLPEKMDTAVLNASADWRLRYERISDDRFKVVIDPEGGIPAYTNVSDAALLRDRANHSKRLSGGGLTFVPQVGVELSITADGSPPIIFTPEEEPEPPVRSVAQ